jgi:hypothetical protein
MNLIKYDLPENRSCCWNADWFLKIITTEREGNFFVEITTVAPPGAATQVGGMMTAKPFITIKLDGAEARLFIDAYNKLISKGRRRAG